MMFSPEDQHHIDEARQRLCVTHDPERRTLLVTRLQHHCWLLFSYAERGTEMFVVEDMATNMNYDHTGAPVPPWYETNAAWALATVAFRTLSSVPVATHRPLKRRFTTAVAFTLATEQRIADWGGFTGDDQTLMTLRLMSLNRSP